MSTTSCLHFKALPLVHVGYYIHGINVDNVRFPVIVGLDWRKFRYLYILLVLFGVREADVADVYMNIRGKTALERPGTGQFCLFYATGLRSCRWCGLAGKTEKRNETRTGNEGADGTDIHFLHSAKKMVNLTNKCLFSIIWEAECTSRDL